MINKLKNKDIFKIISKNTNIEINKINENSKADDFPQWDSMNHINIVLDLQKIKRIKISSSKALELNSVKKILKFLKI
jgi:acyl carrier protein